MNKISIQIQIHPPGRIYNRWEKFYLLSREEKI
ncbi:hypothetical protein KKC1_18340 [Calderihabitans maritimus]|uniref:Uncharacterized protein n=1 Tax=Calderihabitans maritimus TaxID=1246530 RepID=A0A1Z5HT39_9FIRM|nr:hypothetical protein KKC1_18340 [Calderihabitans maritimus]